MQAPPDVARTDDESVVAEDEAALESPAEPEQEPEPVTVSAGAVASVEQVMVEIVPGQ